MSPVHINSGNLDTEIDRCMGEHHVNMKTEISVMHLQSKECQRWPGNHQKWGERHETDSASQPQKEPALPTPWFWNSSLQDCESINFYCWSDPICGTFKWQPQETNIASLESSLPMVQVGSKEAISEEGSSSPQTFRSPAATLVFPTEATDIGG